MSLKEIAVTTEFSESGNFCMLNVSKLWQRVSDPMLELEIRGILRKWRSLIYMKRPNDSISDIESETVDIVMRKFNGDYSMLEPYVKSTALTIPVRDTKIKASIYATVGESEGGEVSLIDFLSEDNKLGSTDFAVNVGRDNNEVQTIREEQLWSVWLEDLRNADNSHIKLDSAELLALIQLSPMLDVVLKYEAEEALVYAGGGYLDNAQYTVWVKSLVTNIVNTLGYSKKEIKKNLSKWLSLYLQNTEVLRRQFALFLSSELLPYNNLKESKLSVGVNKINDMLFINAPKRYQLYKLDFSSIIDRLYDDYFNDNASLLRFEVNGQEFYNVLGGVFVERGDLNTLIVESVCEFLLKTTDAKFVCMTDTCLYVEFLYGETDLMFYWYYFGINLLLHLEFKGKNTRIEGEVIHDFS